MNVLNRPLFQRYARQPMMQQPMMQQPVGIMASSPELMQASMGYNQGGPVLGYRRGTVVQPTVDITQDPIEFQETVTETEVATPGNRAGVIVGETTDSAAAAPEPAPDNSGADELDEALKRGTEAVDKNSTEGDKNLTPSEEADKILAGLGKDTPKGTKEKIGAMKDLIKKTFGVDASRYDNLKSLNRAMVGFAIAEGGDIASALKQGAAGAAAIEEKSLARDDSMSQMALQQVFAEKLAGMRNAAAMAGKASDYTPERLRQRAIEAILRSPDQFNVYNDETGAVDPAKVQREANTLVTAMMQDPDPEPTMAHKQANDAAKEKGEPFYTLDGKKFKVQ